MRAVVVGGGIIGLACAWRLARGGNEVVLCDAAPTAREASWAAAGMLAPHLEAERPDALWRLGVRSLARWREIADELGAEAIDHHEAGGLLPAEDEAGEASARTRCAMLEEAGVAARWLTRADLARHEPGLASTLRGALSVPGAHVDPRRALAALQTACATAGVTLRYGAAAHRVEPGEAVLCDRTAVRGDVVVIASGAWTPALAAASGLDLRGEPVKGQVLRLAGPPGLLRAFVHAHHAYLVPRADGSVVVGATMVSAGFDRAEDEDAIRRLAEGARRLVPALAQATVSETWTGLRPRLAGGQPLIARVAPGLIVATGHFRNGILLAPATADAVAALAIGGPLDPVAVPFAAWPPR